MPEDTARPRCNGDEVERVQLSHVHRRRQRELEDQFARARPHSDIVETQFLIQAACRKVVGGHQQAHPPAAVDSAQTVQYLLHCRFAVATPLNATIQREPAEPPARTVPQFRVHDEEARKRVVHFDRNDGVSQSVPDSIQDVADGAEESFDLIWVELKGTK